MGPQRPKARARERQEEAASFAADAARLLADRHCEDVVVLELRGLSQVCDFLVVATGTSDRQMKSVSAELEDIGAAASMPVFRTTSDTAATWIVVDFISVVVHLFEPQRRSYYDLEDLWADATRLKVPARDADA